jgi:hypothetical protein
MTLWKRNGTTTLSRASCFLAPSNGVVQRLQCGEVTQGSAISMTLAGSAKVSCGAAASAGRL